MDFNLATVHEAVAAAIADREAIVFRDRRLTAGQLTVRTRQLANHLLGAGFQVHTERPGLRGWESGQDQLALYLHNGNEYLEGMLGAYKARVAPFNVNYRYVAEELHYLLNDAGARGIVYHSAFAPTLDVRATRPPRPRAAPAGRRRVRPRSAARRRLVRGRAGRRALDPAARRAVARRPLHPLHRRARPACPRACCGGRPTSTRRRWAGAIWAPRRSGRTSSGSWRTPATAACD